MRLSVLVLDLLVFFPSVWALSSLITNNAAQQPRKNAAAVKSHSSTLSVLLAFTVLLQPSLIIIDYGHFQVPFVVRVPLGGRFPPGPNVSCMMLSSSQYNSTCLGLALLGAVAILHGRGCEPIFVCHLCGGSHHA